MLEEKNLMVPQGMFMCDTIHEAAWMPYDVMVCSCCKTVQTRYLADLDVLYSAQHVMPIGNIRMTMDKNFADMITSNPNVNGIVEVGGGQGHLADIVVQHPMQKDKGDYYIIDPKYMGSRDKRHVIDAFVESIDLSAFDANTLVMSHFFEHLYRPNEMLKNALHDKVNHVFICHPDFDDYTQLQPLTYNILHCEHTFYIENSFLERLMEKHGFRTVRCHKHMGYAVLYEFEREYSHGCACMHVSLINQTTVPNSLEYFKDIREKVEKINKQIELDTPVYIWPSSIHTLSLFYHGLKHAGLAGVLDNSESKIGKYMYGYNIKCMALMEVVNLNEKAVVFLNGGCYNKDIASIANGPNVTLVHL
jgi:hypothetical protein